MLQPFKIRFPDAVKASILVSREFPPGYTNQIAFASPLFTLCDMGEFLTQSVNGDGYWIEWWSFFVKETGHINMEIMQPHISVAMFLQGDITEQVTGDGVVLLPAKTYNIFYSPVGIQRMNLLKGEYNMLFFIPPTYYLDDFVMDYSGMNEIVDRLLSVRQEGSFLKSLPIPPAAGRIINQLRYTNKKGTALDIVFRTFMFQILRFYNQQLSSTKTGHFYYSTTHQKAVAVRDYIIANLGDPNLGGLNEMALQFHITSKPLTNEFRKLTGKTIPEFITDERMEWAQQLLSKKEMLVFEIAFVVGYTDTANFIRKFKRKYGYPPRHRP